jgi:hypothetical protein
LEKISMHVSPSLHQLLREELAAPSLDNLTAVVLARQDLARNYPLGAVSRLAPELDKLFIAAPLLYKVVTNWEEQRAAEQQRWITPGRH